MENLPTEIEIAFVDQIQAAAQNWRDGVTDYKDFRRSLRNHCRNIYNAGLIKRKGGLHMKPCDVRSLGDCNELKEQGLSFNDYAITVHSTGVFLEIDPYVRFKINHNMFGRFARWYLEDQA